MLDKTRTEAFSDGVIAIAITLLVLDLAVPVRSTLKGSLWAALGDEWPSYLAYSVSFLTIGIIWMNHHALFAQVRQVDRWVMWSNLLLLMVVVVIPFPTKLLAEYLTSPHSSQAAAVVYSATMLAMSLSFTGLFVAVNHSPAITVVPGTLRNRQTLFRFSFGIVTYCVSVGTAFFSAAATLSITGAIALYYCFDQLSQTAREADTETDPAG